MRYALAILVGAVLASGCGCPEADRLTIVGDSPPDTAVVLMVAQEHCPRTIVGTFRWEQSDQNRGGESCKANDWHCPLDAWANTDGINTATQTAMAHEIGHWCMKSLDQMAAERFAIAVNDEARRILDGE